MPGKKFPDLTGDGKVTKKDILKGRGVEGFEDGGEVNADKEKEGRIQEKYPSKGTRTRQGMPSKLTKKDKEELSKLRPSHRDPGQLEREMKLEQELLRRGDDEPVETFRDGGMVRGCKGIQVKGKKFSGTF
jgi:hypothetical protein